MGLGLALLFVLAQAQAPGPAPPPAPIRITAQILGADGRPARNVQTRDVELVDDGDAQQVLGVEPRAVEPRRVAILLDEFHVGAADTAAVRAAVHWFVEEHLRPGDEVAVVKPLDALPAIHFTATRDRLHDSIEAFEGRRDNFTPRSELEAQTVGQSSAHATAARAQIVLSALRALSAHLGGMPGRPAIVVVSDGFVPVPRPPRESLPDAAMVERFANRFDVPIYALSPSAAETGGPQELLRTLSSRTGGDFFAGGDLTDGLRRVSDEMDGGYVITFRPSHPADGRFHEVRVAVRRKAATVRARAGYVSLLPVVASRERPPSALSSRPLRRSGFVNVWAGVTAVKGSDAHIVVTWEPGRSSGDRRRAATVALKASKPDGTVLFDGSLLPIHSGTVGGTDHAEFDTPAGLVQLDMTIFGSRGEKLDTDARDIAVPSVGAGTLLLPPLMVGTRSAREFRDASEKLDTPPEPHRDFSRTERLLIRVPAYSAAPDPPRVTARLLNRTGQEIRALEIAPGPPAGITQFDLPLAPLAPGEYILEFRATAATGTAEQRVSVRITG